MAMKRAAFILADVQYDVLSPSCMYVTAFSIDQSFVSDILKHASPCVNEALLQVAGVAKQIKSVKVGWFLRR